MAARGSRTPSRCAPNSTASLSSRRSCKKRSSAHTDYYSEYSPRTQIMTLPGIDAWCQPETFADSLATEAQQWLCSEENVHEEQEEQVVDFTNTSEDTEDSSANMSQCNADTESEVIQEPVWVQQSFEHWVEDEVENEIAKARMRAKKKRDAESARSIQLMIENGVDKKIIEYAIRENETKPLDELLVLQNLIENCASERAISRQTEIIAGRSTCQCQQSTSEINSLQQSSDLMALEEMLAYAQANPVAMCPCAMLVYKNSQQSNDNVEGYDAKNIIADVLDVTAKVARRNTEQMTPEDRNERRKKLGLPSRPSYLRQDCASARKESNSTSSTDSQRSEFSPNARACPGATSTPASPRTRTRQVRSEQGKWN